MENDGFGELGRIHKIKYLDNLCLYNSRFTVFCIVTPLLVDLRCWSLRFPGESIQRRRLLDSGHSH